MTDIDQREWNNLMRTVGRIEQKLDDLQDIPERVTALEAKETVSIALSTDATRQWDKRDKVYLRIFAAVGSLGAVISTALAVAFHS